MMKLLITFIVLITSFAAWAEEETVPQAPLSEQDQKILDEGRVSGERFGGANMLGAFPGFGLGHAVQGHWREKGWIFTAGEAVTLTMAISEVSKCGGGKESCDRAAWWGGGFAAFKIWEIIDLAYWAERHDERLEELEKQGYQPSKVKALFTPIDGGAVLGLATKF